MGIALELAVLLGLVVLGGEIFARFEIETAVWRKILKWSILIALTLGLYPVIGHWAAVVPGVLGMCGLTFHLIWCRRHGIHPLKATPKRRYYELRGWGWEDNEN